MFKRIFVLLDGSACADQALPLAARIVRASGSPMHVYSQAGATLWIAQFSDPEDSTLVAAAEEHHADLIVLASHRATRIKEWMQGSVAQKVARARPMLVLHDGRTLLLSSLPAKKHPLHPFTAAVALDGSRAAETAIVPAAQLVDALATRSQGSLHLTRAVPRPGIDALLSSLEQIDSRQRAKGVDDAMTYVYALTEALYASLAVELNLAVTWSIAMDSDVANGLIRVAERGVADGGTCPLGGCDLLALATHGHCGKQGWAPSGVTEHILDHTKLPLLIVPPPEK